MKLKTYCLIAFALVFSQFTNAQEGLPIYSDYLTDNYYLIKINKKRLMPNNIWRPQSTRGTSGL